MNNSNNKKQKKKTNDRNGLITNTRIQVLKALHIDTRGVPDNQNLLRYINITVESFHAMNLIRTFRCFRYLHVLRLV